MAMQHVTSPFTALALIQPQVLAATPIVMANSTSRTFCKR